MTETKVLSVFIVDDDPEDIERLAADLKQFPQVGEVHTFQNYSAATLPLLEIRPDVLFLDVEVPGKSGLDFIEAIRPKLNFTFSVVFYTAFSQYMLDAIRHSAIDYLLKPYKFEELQAIIERLCNIKAKEEEQLPYKPLKAGRKMAIQTVNELLLLFPEEVLMFTYSRKPHRSWQITLTNRNTYSLRRNTIAIDVLNLHPNFVRVSNAIILNITYLAAVENVTQRCRLCPPFEDIETYASRRYYSKLKECLDTF